MNGEFPPEIQPTRPPGPDVGAADPAAGTEPGAGATAEGTGPRRAWILYGGLAAAVVIADQLVKRWILDGFRLGVPVEVIGDWFRIVLVHNNGGLFGLFQGQAIVFAAASVLVLAGIVWFEAQAGTGSLVLTIALGLLTGGAIGNLIDRIRFGYVLDFLDAGVGSWRWYTSNVADVAISTSLVLLVVVSLGLAGPVGGDLALHRRSSGR